jgi:hypothetical protein
MNLSALVLFALFALQAMPAGAQNALQIMALRSPGAHVMLAQLEPGRTTRALRRLQISVRFDDSFDASSRALDASGRIGNRGDSRVDIRAEERRAQGMERVDQRVQTFDGGHAMVLSGQSRPVRQRQYIQTPLGVIPQEVTVVQEQASGFEIIPRLMGDSVEVEVVHSLGATQARGRLGEWFELGSVASSTTSGSATRRMWIRVDELP